MKDKKIKKLGKIRSNSIVKGCSAQKISGWVDYFKSMSRLEQQEAVESMLNQCDQQLLSNIKKASSIRLLKDVVGESSVDVSREILKYLDPKSLVKCMMVSKDWNRRAKDNFVWKEKCLEYHYDDIKVAHKRKKLRRSKRKDLDSRLRNIDWYQRFVSHAKIRENWVKDFKKTTYTAKCGINHTVCCATAKDGLIVCGTDMGRLIIFNAYLKKKVRTINAHAGEIHDVFILDGGENIVSGSTDGTLAVHNSRGGKRLATISGNMDECEEMEQSGNFVAAYYGNDNVNVFDLEKATRSATFRLRTPISAIVFVKETILLGMCDGELLLYDVNGVMVRKFEGHTCEVNALFLDWDNNLMVSCDIEGLINIRAADSGDSLQILNCQRSSDVLYIKENKLISFGTDACIWDWKEGKILATIAGKDMHCDGVDEAQLVGHNLLLTSGEDNTVKLWNTDNGNFIRNVVDLGESHEIFLIQATESALHYVYEDDIEQSAVGFISFEL